MFLARSSKSWSPWNGIDFRIIFSASVFRVGTYFFWFEIITWDISLPMFGLKNSTPREQRTLIIEIKKLWSNNRARISHGHVEIWTFSSTVCWKIFVSERCERVKYFYYLGNGCLRWCKTFCDKSQSHYLLILAYKTANAPCHLFSYNNCNRDHPESTLFLCSKEVFDKAHVLLVQISNACKNSLFLFRCWSGGTILFKTLTQLHMSFQYLQSVI